MKIFTNNDFECYDLNNNLWVPFPSNQVLNIYQLTYSLENCLTTVRPGLIKIVEKGYYIVRTDGHHLVVHQDYWEAYISCPESRTSFQKVSSIINNGGY